MLKEKINSDYLKAFKEPCVLFNGHTTRSFGKQN
jgi:hypothetical protein